MATRRKPAVTDTTKELPEVTDTHKEVPEVTHKVVPPPKTGNPENTVEIGGKLVEIKSTKVRYQRDRTAMFYRMLELYPLVDILGMDSSTFGDGRDGDKALMDWLIAVTDDPDLIVENYDTLDTDTIERLLAIFRRVNKIDEKEAKLKNVVTPRTKE